MLFFYNALLMINVGGEYTIFFMDIDFFAVI